MININDEKTDEKFMEELKTFNIANKEKVKDDSVVQWSTLNQMEKYAKPYSHTNISTNGNIVKHDFDTIS